MKSKMLDSGVIVAAIGPSDPEYKPLFDQLVTHYAAEGQDMPREQVDDSMSTVATYYAALFNAITQAQGDIGDEMLEQCNEILQDSDWIVEFDQGVWQAKQAQEPEDENEAT